MSETSVREAATSDIANLRQLEQELIEFERPFDQLLGEDIIYYDLEDLVSSVNSTVLVVEIDSKVVACGYGQLRDSKPYIVSRQHCYLGFIYVKAEFRGHGLSRRIVDGLTDWGRSRDVSHFMLDVYSDNSAAIGAYEKFGFKRRSVSMEWVL